MSAVLSASLIKGASTLRDTRYVTIACVVALLWDSFITISNEIDLIWIRVTQIGLIPTLYLANKYISIITITFGVYHVSALRDPITVDLYVLLVQPRPRHHAHHHHPPPPSCRRYLPTAVFIQLLSEIASKCILTLRVVALYYGNARVKWASWSIFIVSYIASTTFIVLAMKFDVEHVTISVLGTCSVTGTPKIYCLIFIFPLIYEFFMTFLTFKKAIGHAHALRDRSSAPLLRVLYLEKILYFVAITATRIALIYIIMSSQNIYLGLALLWSLDVVLVSRFYLEMVAIGRTGYVPTSIWTSAVITGRDHPEITIFAPQDSGLERGS